MATTTVTPTTVARVLVSALCLAALMGAGLTDALQAARAWGGPDHPGRCPGCGIPITPLTPSRFDKKDLGNIRDGKSLRFKCEVQNNKPTCVPQYRGQAQIRPATRRPDIIVILDVPARGKTFDTKAECDVKCVVRIVVKEDGLHRCVVERNEPVCKRPADITGPTEPMPQPPPSTDPTVELRLQLPGYNKLYNTFNECKAQCVKKIVKRQLHFFWCEGSACRGCQYMHTDCPISLDGKRVFYSSWDSCNHSCAYN